MEGGTRNVEYGIRIGYLISISSELMSYEPWAMS